MNHSYTQLIGDERYHKSALRKTGLTLSDIGRDKSTISLELKRNTGLRGYRLKQANDLAQDQKHTGNQQITAFGFAYIHHQIEQNWSPEQIHGRLKLIGWDDVPCVERIYQYNYQDKAVGGALHINPAR